MSGLNLIQGYSSDSDEGEEKQDDENKASHNLDNPKTKLPVPESILLMKGVPYHEEVVDNPLEHGGRIRSFKHERGNWATLVYIDYFPDSELLEWMKSAVAKLSMKGNFFEEFHASFTRTLILKFHWIDSFVEAVKNVTASFQSFLIELRSVRIYCNEDKTRTFIGITVESVDNSLQKLTYGIDKTLEEYRLPTFYEDASHHISFLWFLGDQRKALESFLPTLVSSLDEFLIDHPELRFVQVGTLKCKIGNKLYKFNL